MTHPEIVNPWSLWRSEIETFPAAISEYRGSADDVWDSALERARMARMAAEVVA